MSTSPMSSRLRVFGLSFGLYVVACATPALWFQHGAERVTQWGIACLTLGALSLFTYVPAWLANVALVPTSVFLLLGFRRLTMAAAAIALALAMTTFAFYFVELPGDEGGVTTLQLVAPLPGFFFWIASMAVPLIGAMRRSPEGAPPPVAPA